MAHSAREVGWLLLITNTWYPTLDILDLHCDEVWGLSWGEAGETDLIWKGGVWCLLTVLAPHTEKYPQEVSIILDMFCCPRQLLISGIYINSLDSPPDPGQALHRRERRGRDGWRGSPGCEKPQFMSILLMYGEVTAAASTQLIHCNRQSDRHPQIKLDLYLIDNHLFWHLGPLFFIANVNKKERLRGHEDPAYNCYLLCPVFFVLQIVNTVIFQTGTGKWYSIRQ